VKLKRKLLVLLTECIRYMCQLYQKPFHGAGKIVKRMINLSCGGSLSRRFLSLGGKKENEKETVRGKKRHYISRCTHTHIICMYIGIDRPTDG